MCRRAVQAALRRVTGAALRAQFDAVAQQAVDGLVGRVKIAAVAEVRNAVEELRQATLFVVRRLEIGSDALLSTAAVVTEHGGAATRQAAAELRETREQFLKTANSLAAVHATAVAHMRSAVEAMESRVAAMLMEVHHDVADGGVPGQVGERQEAG